MGVLFGKMLVAKTLHSSAKFFGNRMLQNEKDKIRSFLVSDYQDLQK